MIEFTLDGRKMEAREGETILGVARRMRIEIPTLCYHDEVSPFGACRLCVVEVKDGGKWQILPSCQTPISKGMEVRTESEPVKESRRLAAELLYYKFPGVPVVREIAGKLGVTIREEDKESNDCILCGLCVRACREVVGVAALKFMDRGLGRENPEPQIGFDAEKCIGCGSCAYICPSGFVKMEAVDGKRIIWDKVFHMASCKVCGRYFAPIEQLEFISRKTGVPIDNLMMCTSCR
jgi:NADH dehydrogenase/NADH:ubiquinone oxidoreductase subunit G